MLINSPGGSSINNLESLGGGGIDQSNINSILNHNVNHYNGTINSSIMESAND